MTVFGFSFVCSVRVGKGQQFPRYFRNEEVLNLIFLGGALKALFFIYCESLVV
jgi:hypothetical protein